MIFKDLTSQTFDRWTVIKRAPDRFSGIKPYTYWVCRCQCGLTREVGTSALIAGASRSCGCLKAELTKERNKKEGTAFRDVMRGYVQSARIRKLDFQLSETQFRALTTDRCYYCGQAPTVIHITKSTKEEFLHGGVDRLDPAVGYIMDNCVPCCSQCNWMKRSASETVFIAKCKEIAKQHTDR
jgi:hypothetical protein